MEAAIKLFKPDISYRPDQIAKKWGLDVKTIYRMIDDLEDPLPAFRPSKKKRGALRVEGCVLIQWMLDGKVKPLEE